ncbi:unnamed protein product [Rotaria magnacalcarata]|uniref:Uncharacterized protein n=1 Tax=Rotaria magnacalcarata TaxID=392030 RepID=A0A816R9F2_9BILA|nr:unnamed protein product [Rotaria magnacalcarata]
MKLSELTQKDHGAELQRHNRSDSELKQQHGILLKAPRPPSSTVDFYFSDTIVNTTPIVDDESAKQNEIIAQQILFTEFHRDLEQDSNKGIEVLESAEYEWKSATRSGQQQTDDFFSSRINSILPLFSYLDKIRYW